MLKKIIVKRVGGLLIKQINDEFIVFDINRGKVYELNPTAEIICKYLWKPRTIEDLTNKIMKEFTVNRGIAEKDINYFINKYKNLLFITKK